MILKVLAAASLVLLFSGCERPETPEFKAFVKKYNSMTRQYCSPEGFLTEETMLSEYKYPDRYLVKDRSNSPVRCSLGTNGEILE